MQFKKSCGRIFGVEFTSAEKRALDLEISRQIAESDIRHADDVDAMMLYALKVHLGFGKKRLQRFYDAFIVDHESMIKQYQMPDDYPWLCKEMLKRAGVDVEAWNRERRKSE